MVSNAEKQDSREPPAAEWRNVRLGGYEHVRLDQIGSVSRGRSKHRPRNDPRLYGGAYPFVQTADVKNAPMYLTQYSQTYNEDGLRQSKLWDKGTLCITIAANIAETAILGIRACFPDSIIGFTADQRKCDVRYVKYQFDNEVQALCKSMSQGATQDNLSVEKLLSIKISLPPLPIQQRIAEVLGAYDDLIENNRRRIALLENMARELYRERFMRASLPFEKKSVFECKFLRFCASRIKRYEGSKLYLATADVNGVGNVNGGERLPFSDLPSRAQMVPEPYSIWFARMSASYKILAFEPNGVEREDDVILSSGFAGFQTDAKHWGFVYCCFSSPEFDKEKDRYATGATQISLTNEGLSNIQIPVYSDDEIEKFGVTIQPLLDLLHGLHRQNRGLARQRDALLPRLMSGKIDLQKLEKEVS